MKTLKYILSIVIVVLMAQMNISCTCLLYTSDAADE